MLSKQIKINLFNAARRLTRRDKNKTVDLLDVRINGSRDLSQLKEDLSWYLPGIPYTVNENRGSHHIHLVYDLKESSFINLLFNSGHSYIVDPDYYSTVEVSNWNSLLYHLISRDERAIYTAQSKQNFESFQKTNCHKNSAFVYGSGPSIDAYKKHKPEKDSLRVICNSLVKNKEFIEYVRPDAICFADPVFHFARNSYAEAFRTDLVRTLESQDTYAFIPDFTMPLMCRHYPHLADKFIGVTYGNQWNIPASSKLEVRATNNILSLLMLPVAASISSKISMLGMDGKNPAVDEDYFWKHHDDFQYTSLIEEVKIKHPSFFRDRSYSGYNNKHNSNLERLFTWLESKSFIIESLNSSHISSIDRRFIINH